MVLVSDVPPHCGAPDTHQPTAATLKIANLAYSQSDFRALVIIMSFFYAHR